MPQIDKHRPGAFCWIELATTDQNGAKNFYTSLFGWNVREFPMGPAETYTIFQLQGRDSAAAYTLRAEQRSMGVPPHWMIYVAVDDADASVKKSEQLKGKTLAPAFDVGPFGRMAVLQDPTGATFSIWQPKENRGIGIASEPGALCWADLSTGDQETAGKFYSALFGWELMRDTDDNPPSNYLHIKNGEDFIGGIPPAEQRSPGVPAHWLAYFQVADCDKSAAKARELGAKFFLEPLTMEGVGRFAIMADPQQAVFAIFQPMPRTK